MTNAGSSSGRAANPSGSTSAPGRSSSPPRGLPPRSVPRRRRLPYAGNGRTGPRQVSVARAPPARAGPSRAPGGGPAGRGAAGSTAGAPRTGRRRGRHGRGNGPAPPRGRARTRSRGPGRPTRPRTPAPCSPGRRHRRRDQGQPSRPGRRARAVRTAPGGRRVEPGPAGRAAGRDPFVEHGPVARPDPWQHNRHLVPDRVGVERTAQVHCDLLRDRGTAPTRAAGAGVSCQYRSGQRCAVTRPETVTGSVTGSRPRGARPGPQRARP